MLSGKKVEARYEQGTSCFQSQRVSEDKAGWKGENWISIYKSMMLRMNYGE